MTKKTNNNQIWLSPDQDGWGIHKPGSKRDIAHIDTKLEGLERMNQIARNQGLDTKAQRLDGTISTEGNTYPRSRDNFPPRG
jgi:hypothetical protein